MKIHLKHYLLFCFIVFSSTAFGQQKSTAQIHDLTTIMEKQNIVVSYFYENVATQPAFCLSFQNNGKTTITFSFFLKDKNGKSISTQSVTLASGQSVNGFVDASLNKSMVIPLANDQNANEFSVELVF